MNYHVVPKMYDLLSSVEDKGVFEEFFSCFCPYNRKLKMS